MNDERPISFVGTTAADSSTEQTHEFEKPGVITGAKVVTHRGQRYALQNTATIIRESSQTSLWEPLDKDFLAGNGQVYDLSLRFEFEEGDVLRLHSQNVNQDGHTYHHNMTISIDYETALTSRVSDALRGVL